MMEMSHFLEWFNTPLQLDPVLKAGIALLWIVTIHPFEDGNGDLTPLRIPLVSYLFPMGLTLPPKSMPLKS